MKDVQERTVSLTEMLGRMAKQRLDSIRRVLQVPGASQLKKQELVQCLGAYMLEHLEQHLERLDHARYALLRKVSQATGLALPIDEFDPDRDGELSYYECYGFMFLRDDALRMPDEIREGLLRADGQRLKPIYDRNTEWIRLTQGLLYYYGTLEVPELIEQVGKYAGPSFDIPAYLSVVGDLELYNYSIIGFPGGFSHYMVDDPQKIIREHESRPELDYYHLTKAQLLRAASDNFVDRHAGYRQFVAFLRDNWEIDKEEAQEISDDLADCIQQGGSPISLVTRLQEELEVEDEEQLSRLLDALVEMMGKTRLWDLKGHTPVEVFEGERKPLEPLPMHPMHPRHSPQPLQARSASISQESHSSAEVYDFQTKKKVGRNDPCPCGSGKKFKKCCGS